ncbi:LacI family transcriptional regulator [Paracoccaceae bacterium]|nr:LacI family transcriptional regulator [Paracoccaceae bacterium]
MGKEKWVTMKDVANLANVGTITVSRVLRTPQKVSEPKRKRVLKAIEELGYVPDNTAGALSSSKSRVFGAIVSTINDRSSHKLWTACLAPFGRPDTNCF